MPNQPARQLMIENMQDSLRLVRHLMKFDVEEFAEAIGVPVQTLNNLETKKIKMTATQYIATAALTDNYFVQNAEHFTTLKAILDGDGKNYGAEYETAFRDDSLLKRWFEDFIDFDDEIYFNETRDDELNELVREYKIILDAAILAEEGAENFVEALTAALLEEEAKVIVPLRSLEQKVVEENPKILELVSRMKKDKVLDVRGEDNDPNFRDTIIEVFKRFRAKYELCLITADAELAHEILKLNDFADEEDFETAAGFIEEGAFKFYKEDFSEPFNDWQEL